MKILMLLGFLIALMACSSLVPANVPPQLAATAGVSILITDEIVDAGWFTVNYPDGWRVVRSSIAGTPLVLDFVSPDNSMRITVYEPPPMPRGEATTDASLYERFDYASHANYEIYFRGIAPIEQGEAFDAIFQQVMESIEFR
jgi:hypothetical protein